MSVTLDFLGAARTVTGSRFLVTAARARVLVDCGLFQGLRELRRLNWKPFPVAPGSIDAVVVTHAHLDHSGYLPALVAAGFRGHVIMTPGTAELARIVLLDSAHLLAEDTGHARAHGYSRHDPPLPLYTEADVEAAIRLVRRVEVGNRVEVAPDVWVTLQHAGHILGSASALVEVGPPTRRLLVSGDLGRDHHPLLRPPAPPAAADVVVVESTYGNRTHPDPGSSPLAAAIRRTVARGGSLVVPAFAVDRTELLLMELRRLREAGEIPDVPVYVDSPMALAALHVYRSALRRGGPELRDLGGRPDAALDLQGLTEAHTREESMVLNAPAWPSIIISASGMATGGRVLHHLASMLPDSRNSVVLTGFQAEGTRGRDLLDGATTVKIHGRYVPVRAEVVDVPTFSVHADADEIVRWLGRAPRPPDVCYVVHGEPRAAETLRARITTALGWTAVIPRLGERVRLD